MSQTPPSAYPIVVSDWNWVTAKGSVNCLINLILERHSSSEAHEVKYVTIVKIWQFNGSRPFCLLAMGNRQCLIGNEVQPPTPETSHLLLHPATQFVYATPMSHRRVGWEASPCYKRLSSGIWLRARAFSFFATGCVDLFDRWSHVGYRIFAFAKLRQ